MHQTAIEHFSDWVHLIQSEYLEMPGLHLSKRQAQKLWNLDRHSTEIIFDALETAQFLKRTPDGLYVRADVGDL
jgi:hypothetical protein